MHLRYCNYHVGALLIMCLLSSVARFDPRLSPPTSRHEVSRPGTFPSSSCACSRRYLARGGFDAPAENSTMSSTCQHHMSNSCPASHESLHRWVLNACSWCLACLTCQVPLRSSFWFSLNDGSLDAPCEDATFSIRQEPAADRLLSWWSARAARPHCACCQDRRLPFTSTLLYSTLLYSTLLYSWCWHVGCGDITWSPTTYPQHLYIQHLAHNAFLHHDFAHTSVPHTILWRTRTFPRMSWTHSTFAPTPVPHHSFTHNIFTRTTFHTPLLHGTFSHTSLRHAFLAHTDPSPSLFSFLPLPSHFQSFSRFFGHLLEEIDMWGYPVL